MGGAEEDRTLTTPRRAISHGRNPTPRVATELALHGGAASMAIRFFHFTASQARHGREGLDVAVL